MKMSGHMAWVLDSSLLARSNGSSFPFPHSMDFLKGKDWLHPAQGLQGFP